MLTKFINRLRLRGKIDKELVAEVEKVSSGKPLRVSYVTKPLQYMNLKAITMDNACCNILIIGNHFIQADKFVDFLRKKDLNWDIIKLVQDTKIPQATILRLPRIIEFWTSTDSGTFFNLFLKELHQKKCKIKMIEEGLGNYVHADIGFTISHPFLTRNRWFSKLTFELLRNIVRFFTGCGGDGMNLSKWLDELHLYHPEYPKIPCRTRSVLRKLPLSAIDNFRNLDKFFDFSNYSWISSLQNKKVLILPTNWTDDPIITENDSAGYDVIIVKYHPHLKDRLNSVNGNVIYMAGALPTEILVFKLLNLNCDITLRGQYTSSLIYLLGTSVKLDFESEIPDFMYDFFQYVLKSY